MAQPTTIKILKPGTFTDVRGTKVTFSKADLEGLVASYDRASDPAPLVVGHPKIDAPAYGWVGGLAFEDGHVVATPDQVAPAFAEAVNAGAYPKISPQLYPPQHPSNPKPGSWYLQHVGFLGGAAPAIKGLGTVSFSAADDDAAITLTIDQEPTVTDTISLSEHEGEVSTLRQQIEELQEAARLRDEQDAQNARDAQHDQNVAFADGLVAAGTLAPVGKDVVVGLMDHLDASNVVSFGEGDGAQELTPLAAFRSLFDSAHPVISLGEHAPAAPAAKPPTLVVSFAAPSGYAVAEDNAALHARAKAIQAERPELSFWQAFSAARAEGVAG